MRLAPIIFAAAAALAVASPASALTTTYTATLSGANESPPNASPGTGFATVTFDLSAKTMNVSASFAGLVAGVTASHIHCCTAVPGAGAAGVATTTPTFTGFPSGVTSGAYDHLFDMTLASSYNPAFVTAHTDIAGAYSFLLAGVAAGDAYLNIHSAQFPSGEIRGFLVPVPEPETYALMLAGLVVVSAATGRRAAKA